MGEMTAVSTSEFVLLLLSDDKRDKGKERADWSSGDAVDEDDGIGADIAVDAHDVSRRF
jgi:hypothetical protein